MQDGATVLRKSDLRAGNTNKRGDPGSVKSKMVDFKQLDLVIWNDVVHKVSPNASDL